MKTLILLCLSFLCVNLYAQNFVPNPDFHDFISCPQNISDFSVAQWIDPVVPPPELDGTSDYYNICGNMFSGIPVNLLGNQSSDTGQGYIGLITIEQNSVWREYAQVELTQPLIEGACYELTMTYNRADMAGASNNLGLLLTNGVPTGPYVGQQPQLEVTSVMNDNVNWVEAKSQYTAVGGENTVTLGNFRDNGQTTFVPGPITAPYAYYYVDFVSVEFVGEQSNDVEVDIGDDVYICEDEFPVIIESNNPNAINVWSTGSNAPSISVNSPGKYYLTIFDNCEFGIDSLEIFIIEEPELELEDQEFCEGESFTFNLDPTLGDYEWDDGSNSADYTVSEEGVYTVQLTHDCGVIEQTIEVQTVKIIEQPIIQNYFLCETDLPLIVELFDFNNGVNEFNWSTGSDESLIFITEAGDYSVDVFNECFFEGTSFSVFVEQELPLSVPFSDTLLCPGESVFINTGLFGIDLEWQDGSNTSSYFVEEPGTYTLTATNNCGSQEYVFVIKESSELVFDLGEDVSICPGDSVLLVSPLDEELLWNGTVQSEEIWIKEEGYVIAEYNGVCNFATDSILVLLNGQSPEIDLPDSLLLCAGDSLLLTAGSGSIGVDYTWSTGSTNNEIYISEAGTYDVMGLNSCGEDMDSVVITIGESLPQNSLENLYIICPGDTLELMLELGTAEITWSTGSQDSFVQITDEGIYNVLIGNTCKTEEIGFAIQFEETLSDFDLGEDKSICAGESVEIQGPIAEGTYIWNTTEITSSIEVSVPGIYVLEIDGICNTVIDSIEVIDLGEGPDVELGENIQICEGDSIDLTLIGNGIQSILWNTGDTTESIQIYNEGTYIVEVLNVCGSSIDSTSLTYNTTIPQIELGFNQQICEGDSILLDVGTQSGTIVWNTGETGESIFVQEEGWYEAILSSSCGESIDSVFISTLEVPESFDLGMDTIICEGESFVISIPGIFFLDIEWQNGSIFSDQMIDNAQTYWLSVSNECGEVRDSIDVGFHPRIDPFSFDPIADLCLGDSVILEGYQDNAIQYSWQDNSNESTYIVTETGIYSLIVESNCESFDSEIQIEFIEPFVLEANIDSTYLFCEGEILEVDLETIGIDGILWSDGSTEFERVFTEAGEYVFELFNFCQDSSYRFELAFEDCIADLIYVPNVFSPNDDGNNDSFTIEIPSDWVDPLVETSIYNRWGEQMYFSEDPDFGWDGQFKGKGLNPGVYVYLIRIEVEIEDRLRQFVLQGDITILQ